MFNKAVIYFLLLIFLFTPCAMAQKVWQAQNSGLKEQDIRSISVFRNQDKLVCAASAKEVYLSQDGGGFWKGILSLQTENSEINFVTFDFSNQQILYLAATKGLFVSKNQGQDWQKLFSGIANETKNINWVTLDHLDTQRIYLGTDEGLYLSPDSGASWRKADGGLPRSAVRSIAIHPANSYILYLANNHGLFKTVDRGQSWERIYVTSPKISEENDEEDSEDEEEEQESLQGQFENQGLINCIAIDKQNSKKVYLATGEGVLVSTDAGESWNRLPTQGLTCDQVNFIVISARDKDTVYAATQNGVFEFLPQLNKWQKLYRGMTYRQVYSLSFNRGEQQLFAGTDRGVFKTVNIESSAQEEKAKMKKIAKADFPPTLQEICLNEPTVRQVQEAALRYGEVIHPDQIRCLRHQARLKALLPDVSLDYDKTIQEGGTSTHFGDFSIGPHDWGLNLSWDVGELVFSEQLRLIDSNARLAVQLRNDILNEVTRLYYERRKLQSELILTPPKTEEQTMAKTLRLEELTANIDALTGGYFSRELNKNKTED